ncbi:MAG: hypothetical protein KDA75_07670 [Planctomycetaceae bacterium]|nr:hypothetical protein [Planctomycetaceae bacterium]
MTDEKRLASTVIAVVIAMGCNDMSDLHNLDAASLYSNSAESNPIGHDSNLMAIDDGDTEMDAAVNQAQRTLGFVE